MMTQSERSQVVAETLLEVANALLEAGAAGPTNFWFEKLAERLTERAKKRTDDARRSA